MYTFTIYIYIKMMMRMRQIDNAMHKERGVG